MTEEAKTQTKYCVTTFYKFFAWPQSKEIKQHALDLENWCKEHGIKGLIIVSNEGFNGTVASTHNLSPLKSHLEDLCQSKLVFKDSFSNQADPFRRMKVKLRKEIVTLGNTQINPSKSSPKGVAHISPQEWHQFLNENPDVQLVDVRNDFEAQMGSFKYAQNWKMNKFTEFPDLVEKSGFEKDKPVLMFCTGGIRCEKASLEMNKQGYNKVYQLDGGILNYMQQFPNGHFEGECFVFDHRVSLDQNLNPSKQYSLCTHCGQPASKAPFNCAQCHEESYGVCDSCWDKSAKYHTCSKNCAHHFEKGHVTKRPHKEGCRKKGQI